MFGDEVSEEPSRRQSGDRVQQPRTRNTICTVLRAQSMKIMIQEYYANYVEIYVQIKKNERTGSKNTFSPLNEIHIPIPKTVN